MLADAIITIATIAAASLWALWWGPDTKTRRRADWTRRRTKASRRD